MKISLDPSSYYVNDDGTFNQRKALINAGVKAAVCYKEGDVTPTIIREGETDDVLIKRAINTILNDHTTPSEQQVIGLEIVGIPKILCMILNNEHQYSACERSLRYTPVKESSFISSKEIKFYQEWLRIFNEVITKKYFDFYRKFNSSDKNTMKAINKLAQENARYGISIFMPTTLTYKVPLAQINKIYLYNEELINNPLNELEISLIPYLQDFNSQLKQLKVIVMEKDAKNLCPDLSIVGEDRPLYKNNKHIQLSLFSYRNKFSGINNENQFGYSFSYNFEVSWASYAQFHRHRTEDFEIGFLDEFKCCIPPIISDDKMLTEKWLKEMNELHDIHPQGEIIKANMSGTLKNLINFIGKERACEHAQLETESIFLNKILPDYYDGLVSTNQEELATIVKPYVKKLRCAFPDYNCPKGCGHPRLERNL